MNVTFADALRELAEPRPVGDLVKAAIARASRLTGLTYTRTFDVWYGKARRIDAHEAEQIAAALERKREDEARNEIADLRLRLLKMESRIAAELRTTAALALKRLGSRCVDLAETIAPWLRPAEGKGADDADPQPRKTEQR